MKYFFSLIFLLVSCTRCVTPAPPEITPEEQVTLNPGATEPFAILFTDKLTAIKINGSFFPQAKAFDVVYKGDLYGLFLPDDVIYLPAQAIGEKAKLDLITKDAKGKDIQKKSWYITRGD